jgi:hypothetical protein
MAWTAPRTWVTGEVVTASQMNTHVRDNLNALASEPNRQVGTSPLEQWYPAGVISAGSATTNAVSALGRLFAIPLLTYRGGTVDRLGIEVTILATSGVARIGIYQATSGTNLYPSALTVDGGEVLTSTTGVKTVTINTTLTPTTLYYACVIFGTALPSVRSIGRDSMVNLFGMGSTFGAVIMGWGIKVAQTYGALPATFPAGGTVMVSDETPILIGVRYSA